MGQEQEYEEENNFKKLLIFILVLFILVVLSFLAYFYFSSSKPNKNVSVNTEVTENSIEVVAKEESIVEEEEVLNPILDIVQEKEIFHYTSNKPDGFYVMVGTFANYENAVNLEKMNPTNFACHIFDPNENNLNRVGLYVTKDDDTKAEMALDEIRKMKSDSWLLYNSQY